MNYKYQKQFYQLNWMKQKENLTTPQLIKNYHSSQAESETKHKERGNGEIDLLVNRFHQINKTIDITTDQRSLNLINYELENEKNKYDPQIMTAKLRKLENRAEINRAQMEIDSREKKFIISLKKRKKNEDNEKYKEIYEKHIRGKDFEQNGNDDSEEETIQKSEGIMYYNKLKKHPKILQYTFKKITDKSIEKDEWMSKVKQAQDHIRTYKQIPQEYKEVVQEINKQNKTAKTNPENMVENSFAKVFMKKGNEQIKRQVRENPRCNKMISRQNQILIDMDERSLSKEGRKKLKSRLNDIVMEMSKSEKNKTFMFPKLKKDKEFSIE